MKLFQKVHCTAYMKAVKDGVYIQLYNADGTLCTANFVKEYKARAIAYKEDKEIKDLSEFDSSCVEKTYRKRVEAEFDGVVVGFTRVDVKGLIGTDWSDDPHAPDVGYCFKEITERPKVGVVYFRNNCKRYVLPEDMKIVDAADRIANGSDKE